jgi:isoleucyl-tRNA synthetase
VGGEGSAAEGFNPAFPEGPTPHSDNLLDRWVLARLNQVVEQVEKSLENSDLFAAASIVEAFIDDLTNWYVRRSRRRFWKSEHDNDKNNAYATLYHLLVKLTRLLAPFSPFVVEVMYQNLVCAVRPSAYQSVHHTTWPQVDAAVIDANLLDEMELARQIASLGLSARNSAGLKVRQPLAKALVYAGGERSLGEELVAIVTDELNVKAFEFVAQAGKLVNYRLLPDNKLLGPRFGAQFPKVRAALAEADAAQLAASVNSGQPVQIQVEGQAVELAPEEILVQTQPVEGLAVAADKIITVAVDSNLTPELRAEGLAREIVRRVQALRKDAGFNIEDRITTYYVTGNELSRVIADWGDYIRAETLSTRLVAGPPPAQAYAETQKIDDAEVTLGVHR